MPVATIRSFSGGEIAPSLHARVDTAKYQTGLKTMENFIVMKHGGAVRRPGMQYIDNCVNGDYVTRLIPFAGTDDESFIIELGHYYMRVHQTGDNIGGVIRSDTLFETMSNRFPGTGPHRGASTVTGIASDLTVTIAHTGSSFPFLPKSGNHPGSVVRFVGDSGVSNTVNRSFKVYSINRAAGTMRLMDMNDSFVTADGSYSSAVAIASATVLQTPWSSGFTYDTSEVFNIRYTQSHGKMYLTADNYPIMVIERTDTGRWSVKRFEAGESEVPRLGESKYYYLNTYPYTIIPDYDIETTSRRPKWLESTYSMPAGVPVFFTRSVIPQGTKVAFIKDATLDHIRYAVSVVDHLGRESLPRYSDYVVRRGSGSTDVGLTTIAASNETVLNDVGGTFTWESPDGLGYRVGIGDPVQENDSFQIRGKDWQGRDIDETITAAGNGYTFGDDGRMMSVNYFVSVQKVISLRSLSADTRTFYRLDSDLDNNLIEFVAPDEEPVLGYRFTYRVYKSTGGRFGLIGETENLHFHDYGVSPDLTETPLFQFDPFSITAPAGVKDYDSVMWSPARARSSDYGKVPYAAGQYQQRLLFGRTDGEPERIWCSAIAQYNNFNPRAILKDDSSFSFSLSGQTRGAIQHLLTLGKLIIFTDVGEWVIGGSDSGSLTPTQINAKQIGYAGTGKLGPLMVGQDVIFLQPRGCIVRDLGWNMSGSGYSGNDLTVFAGHLFKRKQIRDWDYQQNPESVVWACMSDGSLLAMSYLKEHQIIAWHRHHLGGSMQGSGSRPHVESVASIPEGSGATRRDAVYMVVRRYIDGEYVRTVERMADASEPSHLNYKLSDSHYAFNGWLDEDTPETIRSESMTITEYAGGGFDSPATVTMTASVGYFDDVSVDDEIHFGDPGDVDVRVTVTSISSSTVALGTISGDVPAALQGAATFDWGYAPASISALYHLHGEDVAITGDGAVLASPFNSDYSTVTVAGASSSVDVPTPSCIVSIGLPYSSNLQTLNMDTVDGETLADKKKLVSSIVAHLEDAKGGFYGKDPGAADVITGLYEMQYDDVQEYQDTNELYTGLNEIVIEAGWGDGGNLYIRQVDPLPMSVLSLHPRLNVTNRGR